MAEPKVGTVLNQKDPMLEALRSTEFQKTQTFWVAWGNRDQTEGRGPMYAVAVCEMEATAHRLSMGKDVQGSKGPVTQVTLEYQSSDDASGMLSSGWVGLPVSIQYPTSADKEVQARLDEKAKAIAAAKAAGLTDEQIKALVG